MQQNIFKRLNGILVLLFAMATSVINTTILKHQPWAFFQPQLMVIVIVYLGFKREIVEGGLLTAFCTLIMSSQTSAPFSYLLTANCFIFALSKVLSKLVAGGNRLTPILVTMGLSGLWKLCLLLLLSLEGRMGNGLIRFAVYLVPELLGQLLFTPPLHALLARLDLWTYKDAHAEDEYDINRDFSF